MKKLTGILIVSALITGACSSTKQASNSKNYDDVYYSSKDAANESAAIASSKQTQPDDYTQAGSNDPNRFDYGNEGNPSTSETTTDGNGTTYITNNYYNQDDYYDYAYSSNIRRFHTSVNMGFGYYNPYFTNSYWYDYNP